MVLERRVFLVVEVVQQAGDRPAFLRAVIVACVEPHRRLDAQRVLDEVGALRVFGEQPVRLLPGRGHGAGAANEAAWSNLFTIRSR